MNPPPLPHPTFRTRSRRPRLSLPASLRFSLSTFHFPLLLLLLLAGCASPDAGRGFRPRGPVPPRDASLPAVLGQYADPSAEAFPLYEVLLVNTGAAPRVFSSAELDGRVLVPPAAARLDAPPVSVGGLRLALPAAAADPDLAWWQFLPSATVPPGGSAVFRLSLREDVRARRNLVLRDLDGGAEAVAVPPRRAAGPGVPRLAAVAWAHDLSRAVVLCDSPGNPPGALWIDGRPAAAPRVLSSPAAPRNFLVEAGSPVPLAEGAPVELRVRFADGRVRFAHQRVVPGVSVYDAPAGDFAARHAAPDGEDTPCACDGDTPGTATGAGACLLPVDATCADLRAGRPGDSAWRVARERGFLRERSPRAPAGVALCTGTLPATAAIYGRAADAVFSKPYRLGWGGDPARFVDAEADTLAAHRAAAAPLPLFYIPERFARRGGRRLAPGELETLEWTAIVQGAKGLRRQFAYNKGGLAATPDLAAPLRSTAEAVRRLRPLLAPLVPVSDETRGGEAGGYVRVFTAWSGSRGALYLVRRRGAAAGGGTPADTEVELDVPPWCRGRDVLDPLTGERLAASRPGRLRLSVPGLATFRLLWVDADPDRPAPLR